MTGMTEGSRGRGRPRMCWLDNIFTWTGLQGVKFFGDSKGHVKILSAITVWHAITQAYTAVYKSDSKGVYSLQIEIKSKSKAFISGITAHSKQTKAKVLALYKSFTYLYVGDVEK